MRIAHYFLKVFRRGRRSTPRTRFGNTFAAQIVASLNILLSHEEPAIQDSETVVNAVRAIQKAAGFGFFRLFGAGGCA
jgi:hypothetical protein